MIGKKDASSGGWVDAPVKPRDCRMYAWKDDLDDTPPNCHTPLTAAHKPLDPMHRAREAAAGAERAQAFNDWNDGQPGTELNFKFYRQATNKIAGISDEAAAFLDEFF